MYMVLDDIGFNSSHMWADESKNSIYVDPSLIGFTSEKIIQFPLN